MTGNNAASGSAAASSSLPISFQRSTEQKVGEKLSDIAVVSLVPPGSSHQSSNSGGAAAASSGAREDYDSSATVRRSSKYLLSEFAVARLAIESARNTKICLKLSLLNT